MIAKSLPCACEQCLTFNIHHMVLCKNRSVTGIFDLQSTMYRTAAPKPKDGKPKKPETPQKKRKRSEIADPWASAETRKGVAQQWDVKRYKKKDKSYRFSPGWFKEYAPKTQLLGSPPSPIKSASSAVPATPVPAACPAPVAAPSTRLQKRRP